MFANLNPGAIGIRTGLAGTIDLAERHRWHGCDLPDGEAVRLVAAQSPDAVSERRRGLRSDKVRVLPLLAGPEAIGASISSASVSQASSIEFVETYD